MAKKQQTTEETEMIVTWTDQPFEISGKYGVWRQGEPRTGFTPEAIEELGATPGFVIAERPVEKSATANEDSASSLPASALAEASPAEPASENKEHTK